MTLLEIDSIKSHSDKYNESEGVYLNKLYPFKVMTFIYDSILLPISFFIDLKCVLKSNFFDMHPGFIF
jgi:hypothetical protein